MPAYWLSRVKVTDPESFRKYAALAPGIITGHGGKFIGAGETRILEGSPIHDRFMVIEFASLAEAEACYASNAYQAASRYREGAAELEIIIIDGGSVDALAPV